MTCTHDIVERDVAVSADGYCPLCQAAEIARLKAALNDIVLLDGKHMTTTKRWDHALILAERALSR
jgi:hypothetical protein